MAGFVARGNAARAQRAFDVLVEEWAAVGRRSREEAEPVVRRLLTEGDPEADDRLHEAFRRMADATSGAAWPYIARMTASYIQAGLPADDFFMRCGRLLERCTAADVEILASTARQALLVASGDPSRKLVTMRWSIQPSEDESITPRIDLWAFKVDPYPNPPPPPRGGWDPEDVEHVASLLVECGLARVDNGDHYFRRQVVPFLDLFGGPGRGA